MAMKVPDLPELRERFNLTPLQARFVQELPAQDWNGSAAAEAAGYASNYRKAAHRNLQKEKIQLALSAYTEALAHRAELRVEDLIEEYRRIAFSDITDVVSWNASGRVTVTPSAELPSEVTSAVKKFRHKEYRDEDGNVTRTEIELEFHDKKSAMDKLGQYLGLWKDPNEIRVQILQVFAQMTPEELAQLETKSDDEILEMIEENGVWRLPDGVGS